MAKPLFARCGWLVAAVLALGAVICFCLTHPSDDSRPAAADLDSGGARTEGSALEERWQDLTQRVARRQRFCRELIAGRLTLREAAAQFQQLDAASKTFNWAHFRARVPGATDEEKQCHVAIEQVRSLLGGDPEQERAVTRRLEAELQVLYAGAPPQPSGTPGPARTPE